MNMSEGKPVEKMLRDNRGVLTIRQTATALMAGKKMRRHEVGCLVVTGRQGEPVGIVTERDLVNKLLAEGKDPARAEVQDIMSTNVISVCTSAPIVKAQALMAKHKIRHLPVIEDGLLLGMISSRDIVSHQLAGVRSILQRQMKLFEDLEAMWPALVG